MYERPDLRRINAEEPVIILLTTMIAKSPAFVLVFGSNREGQAGVGCSDDSDCIYSPMPIHSDDSVTTLKFLMFIEFQRILIMLIDIQGILSIAPNFGFCRPTNRFKSCHRNQADFHFNNRWIGALLRGK